MMTTANTATADAGRALRALIEYLKTPEGGDYYIDRAVLGCLPKYELRELADDYRVTYADAARALDWAIQEGA